VYGAIGRKVGMGYEKVDCTWFYIGVTLVMSYIKCAPQISKCCCHLYLTVNWREINWFARNLVQGPGQKVPGFELNHRSMAGGLYIEKFMKCLLKVRHLTCCIFFSNVKDTFHVLLASCVLNICIFCQSQDLTREFQFLH
jgi:hypothetical protein